MTASVFTGIQRYNCCRSDDTGDLGNIGTLIAGAYGRKIMHNTVPRDACV